MAMDGAMHVGPTFPLTDAALPVLDSAPIGTRYHRLVLAAPGIAGRAVPGQFFHLLCAEGGGLPYLRRPMSLWRDEGGSLGFLFNVSGRGTAALAAKRPGDTVTALGPLGAGFRLDPAWRRILILARGAGLATLAPLATLAARHGMAVDAVLSARHPDDLMAAEFAGASGAQVHPVFDADGTSDPDAVGHLLRRLIAQARPDAVFTCGSARLLRLLQRVAAEAAIPGQVALEQQMACGLGMCFCCVRPVRQPDGTVADQRVCTDGPVFDLQAAMA